MGEINRWGCRRSVSLFCWERGREKERKNKPANIHTMCLSKSVFIHARHDAVGTIFALHKKLFSMSIKGSGDEGRLHESLCACVSDMSQLYS